MKGANILPCPVPSEISNSPDNAPEYNTHALTSVYKFSKAYHTLPLTPKSENKLYNNQPMSKALQTSRKQLNILLPLSSI